MITIDIEKHKAYQHFRDNHCEFGKAVPETWCSDCVYFKGVYTNPYNPKNRLKDRIGSYIRRG